MRPDALAAMIAADRDAGLVPFFVCATRGTTSSMAFDPTPSDRRRSAERERRVAARRRGDERASPRSCPSCAGSTTGSSRADSYCTNPHKWMGVNFDCDLFWTADRAALLGALSILPEYLRSAAAGIGRGDRLPRLADARSAAGSGRSSCGSRSRLDGVESFQAMIRRHVALTQELAGVGGRRRPVRDRRPAPAEPAVPRASRRRRRDRRI